jgi:hypothetical protein
MTLSHGPQPGLSLAACYAGGCRHRECAAAAAATARTGNHAALADAIGSRRRLQALAAFGWPAGELARRLRIPVQAVVAITCSNAAVPADRAAAIRALYDALWDVPGGNRHVARRARRRGWPPPLGWDDDPDDGHGIDDPGAVPAPGWRRTSSQHHLDDLIEDLAAPASQGNSSRAAGQRGQGSSWPQRCTAEPPRYAGQRADSATA